MRIATGRDVGEARQARGLTQDSLARMAGVSVRSIRRAENGDTVSAETLRCLAAALDVPFDPAIVELVDPVDRVRSWLGSPVKPMQWAVSVGFAAMSVALPLCMACMTFYPGFYAVLHRFHPAFFTAFFVMQTFGVPFALAVEAYLDLSLMRKRPPTQAGARSVFLIGALTGLTAFAGLLVHLGSSMAPEERVLPDGMGWLSGPLGPLLLVALAFCGFRSTTAGELRYVAWRERLLRGRAPREGDTRPLAPADNTVR